MMSLCGAPGLTQLGLDPTMASSYLRLSVTDRCNLHCLYCRCDASAPFVARAQTLRYEEMLALIHSLHRAVFVRKVRITGGEPLVRAGLPTLIAGLRQQLPHAEICLTTNGILLDRHADSLRAAGLDRINISLDSLDPDRFALLTGGGDLGRVLAGLRAARAAGFSGTKINTVLLRSINGDQLPELVHLAAAHDCQLRFIELMPVGDGAELFDREFLSTDEAVHRLRQSFEKRGPESTHGTARLIRLHDGHREHVVGLITSVSHPFCGGCDRLRLDCRGRLYDCLRCEDGTDLMAPLRLGARVELERRIRQVVLSKQPGAGWPAHRMVAIGG